MNEDGSNEEKNRKTVNAGDFDSGFQSSKMMNKWVKEGDDR